jgi:hypothetical protein
MHRPKAAAPVAVAAVATVGLAIRAVVVGRLPNMSTTLDWVLLVVIVGSVVWAIVLSWKASGAERGVALAPVVHVHVNTTPSAMTVEELASVANVDGDIAKLREELAKLAQELADEPDVEFKPDFKAEYKKQVGLRNAAIAVAEEKRAVLLRPK